jgi:hypothetical protein
MHGLQSRQKQHPSTVRQTASVLATHILGLQQGSGTQSRSRSHSILSATSVLVRTQTPVSPSSASQVVPSGQAGKAPPESGLRPQLVTVHAEPLHWQSAVPNPSSGSSGSLASSHSREVEPSRQWKSLQVGRDSGGSGSVLLWWLS